MEICPKCYSQLDPDHRTSVLSSICTNCGTRSIQLGTLKNLIDSPKWQNVFRKQQTLKPSTKKKCERDACQIQAFDIESEQKSVEVDICYKCEQVWFDFDEVKQTTSSALSSGIDQQLSKELLQEISKIAVNKEGKVIPQHMSYRFSFSDFKVGSWGSIPRSGKKIWLALLGFPIEEQNRLNTTPWRTYLLLALFFSVSIFAFHIDKQLIFQFGFLPSDPFRHFGLTPILSTFFHGDYGHLLGNMYMLYLFGDNVEDKLGWKYLLLFIVGDLVGCLVHSYITHSPDIVVIGASTGISAIIAFYALSFPKTKIAMLFLFFIWVRIPVIFYVGFWVIMQILGAIAQTKTFIGTSFGGHLGGVLTGILFWLIYRKNFLED